MKHRDTPEVIIGGVLVPITRPDVVIAGLYRGDDPVVGPRGGTPKRGSWRSTVKWTTRVKEAGLPAGFHFHDLRHTGNHLASKSGASTRELMHRMGYGSMRAAPIYQHATDARARGDR